MNSPWRKCQKGIHSELFRHRFLNFFEPIWNFFETFVAKRIETNPPNSCSIRVRIDPNQFILAPDSFGLIFNRFVSNEFQNVFRIGSETYFRMARNSSDSLGLNSNSELSPMRIFKFKFGNEESNYDSNYCK